MYRALQRISLTAVMASILAAASFPAMAQSGSDLTDDGTCPNNPAYGYLQSTSVAQPTSANPHFLSVLLESSQDLERLVESAATVGTKVLDGYLLVLEQTSNKTVAGAMFNATISTYKGHLQDFLESSMAKSGRGGQYFKAAYFPDLVQNETFLEDVHQLTKFSRLAYAPPSFIAGASSIDLNELEKVPDVKAADLKAMVDGAKVAEKVRAQLAACDADTLEKLAALQMNVSKVKMSAPLVQEAAQEGWEFVANIEGATGTLGALKTSNFGYVLQRLDDVGRHEIVVTIRGTNTTDDMLTDIQSTMVPLGDKGIMVHQGFSESADVVKKNVQSALAELRDKIGEDAFKASKIRLTGHSLGGALAILTAYDLCTEHQDLVPQDFGVVTQGAPVVGNHKFVDSFHRHVPNFVAIAQKGDPVTMITGHLGPETYHSLGNILTVKTNFSDPHGLTGYIKGVGGLVNKETTSFLQDISETMFSNTLEGFNIGINATRLALQNPEVQKKVVNIGINLAQKVMTFPLG